jgi:hypothetical protein
VLHFVWFPGLARCATGTKAPLLGKVKWAGENCGQETKHAVQGAEVTGEETLPGSGQSARFPKHQGEEYVQVQVHLPSDSL